MVAQELAILGTRRLKILVAEDNEVNQRIITRMLSQSGHTVTVAANGHEALAAWEEQHFDLVLMDVQMPDMDGFELAEAVRGEQRFAEIPIIALSSSSSPEAIERGRKVGFHDYVAKFDRQSLIAALKEQTVDIIQAA